MALSFETQRGCTGSFTLDAIIMSYATTTVNITFRNSGGKRLLVLAAVTRGIPKVQYMLMKLMTSAAEVLVHTDGGNGNNGTCPCL